MRLRHIKYTPEHMHCLAAYYAPQCPPNTGILCYQSEGKKTFRISATGVVLELDAAVKVVKKGSLKKKMFGRPTGTPSPLDDMMREVAVMKKVKHPNCVQLFEVIDDPKRNELFLVMEYVDGGVSMSLKQMKR